MTDLVQQLTSTSLGSLLSASEVADLVESTARRSVSRGSTLFRAGEQSSALYVILDGAMDVVLGASSQDGTVVATLGAGQLVGELELMTGSLRVASLIATDDTSVLELSGPTFDKMLSDNRPVATKLVTTIAKTLARRLAAVNQRIVSKTPPPPNVEEAEPVEVSDADIIEVDEDDLDVLDKLWG